MNRPRHLQKVIRVVAESGAVYTLMVFLTFIVSRLISNATTKENYFHCNTDPQILLLQDHATNPDNILQVQGGRSIHVSGSP